MRVPRRESHIRTHKCPGSNINTQAALWPVNNTHADADARPHTHPYGFVVRSIGHSAKQKPRFFLCVSVLSFFLADERALAERSNESMSVCVCGENSFDENTAQQQPMPPPPSLAGAYMAVNIYKSINSYSKHHLENILFFPTYTRISRV